MIKQADGESRIHYLARVLEVYMDTYGEYVIDYDEATCDGMCLADDIMAEVESITQDTDS